MPCSQGPLGRDNNGQDALADIGYFDDLGFVPCVAEWGADEATAHLRLSSVSSVVTITDLDWTLISDRVKINVQRSNIAATVSGLERLCEESGQSLLLFDDFRQTPEDKVVHITEFDDEIPLWIVGDLHGDILALESALSFIRTHQSYASAAPRIVFLGDLFDDGGYGIEVVLRIFELLLEAPKQVCLIAGNHDEALSFNGTHFVSEVSPGDFAEFLNDNSNDEWIVRAAHLLIRLYKLAARALFFPDGLLIAHGGFPLRDTHQALRENADWNSAQCLSDFVWTRAHPKARKKIPNRYSRGCQFGHEDFETFCQLAASLGRPVTHMVRGHDHVEERYEIYSAYEKNPMLTTVALSRRLGREVIGPFERSPTVARYMHGSLPQVFRLNIPSELVHKFYSSEGAGHVSEDAAYGASQ